MTMIDIGGESSGNAGLTANAMALGADRNLIFSMRAVGLPTSNVVQSYSLFTSDGLLTIDRNFKLTKTAMALKAKVATTAIGFSNSSIDGTLKLVRGATTVATIPFSVPPAGQLPSPTVTAAMVANPASTVGRNTTKLLRFSASRKDAVGATPIGGAASVWLGKGSTLMGEPSAAINYDETGNWGNTMTTGPNTVIDVVPYDQLADKEAAPTQLRLSWPLGPFVGENATYSMYSSTNGNLPQGTIVQFKIALEMTPNVFIDGGPIASFTIDASGGVQYNPGGGIRTLQCAKGSFGMKSTARGIERLLYKLSTHSKWNVAPWGNSTQQIANTFAEGTINTPPANFTFSAINNVDVTFNYLHLPMEDGTNLTPRLNFRVYSAGKLVGGPGRQYSGSGVTFQWTVTYYTNPSDRFSYGKINVDQSDVADPTWASYSAGTPRGDQYFTPNEKVSFDLTIPSRSNVTELDIYVQEFTTANGVSAIENTVPYKLIYSGSVVGSFSWSGVVINPTVTPPVTNTTNNYPAMLSGNVGWDASDAEEIVVNPGDQLFCELTAGTLSTKSLIQLSVPVTILD